MADRFAYSCRSYRSFSSTLLEEICRSIDATAEEDRDSMRKKRDDATTRFLFKTEEQMANYQRSCMIERWMEKKAVARGRPTPELQLQQEKMSGKDRQYSSSSSSDSSCGGYGGSHGGGFFSSSEAESFPVHPPKPLRTGKSALEKEKVKSCDDSGIKRRNRRGFSDGSEEKQKSESRFVKTKSKALKIYGDLKKVKQPISPGGKVAAFLNSIFAAGNLKKPKVAAASSCGDESPSLKSTTTTCSSASSFSRSCLRRRAPPSSAKSPAAALKRSVRFFPVSVILDEDCHKSLRQNHKDDVDSIVTAIDEELAMHVRKKEQTGCEFELSLDILSKIHDQNRGFHGESDDEDDEFDGASCASSDLFELENLWAIGMEELPVYETTHLQKTMQMD